MNELLNQIKQTFPNASLGNMGGNCMAIIIPWGSEDEYFLVTDYADEDNKGGWQVGFYDADGETPVRFKDGLQTMDDVDDLLEDWSDDDSLHDSTLSEEDFENFVSELLYSDHDAAMETEVEDVVTFSEAGVLTMNKGLVVKMADGSEFHVTIVQSK